MSIGGVLLAYLALKKIGIGNIASREVLAFRHRDGANQLGDEPNGIPGIPYSDYTGYASPNAPMDLTAGAFDPAAVRDPNAWQQLRYRDASGAVPSGFA